MNNPGGMVLPQFRHFDDPKQIQKLAGYAIVANESGKHKGEHHISYRGRKRLRYVLYEAAISVVAYNTEFKEIHQHFITRDKNPLKKMQSMIAVACKMLRVFYMLATTDNYYDGKEDARRHKETCSSIGNDRKETTVTACSRPESGIRYSGS